MPTLAKPEDVATLTGLAATDARITLALRRATGRFIGEAGRKDGDGNLTFFRKTDDIVRLSGRGGVTLLLPSAPIVGVPVVSIDGAAVTDFQVDAQAGILRRVGGVWPDGLGNITVTYTHGYPETAIPEDVEDAVLEHATTLATTMAHVQQESALSRSATHFGAALVGTTQKWVDTVQRYQLGGR